MNAAFLTGAQRASSATHSAAIAPRRATTSNETSRHWTIPGLCWNASVMTSFGNLPVQVLRVHDPIRTSDGTIKRITWIDKIQLEEEFLAKFPDAQPIMIRAGALGPNLPVQDILVSPHQKVAVQTGGYTTELRAARELLGRPGVMRQPQKLVTYYMFHLGQPAKVTVDGLSVHTAP